MMGHFLFELYGILYSFNYITDLRPRDKHDWRGLIFINKNSYKIQSCCCMQPYCNQYIIPVAISVTLYCE